jgi:hypothetical protein
MGVTGPTGTPVRRLSGGGVARLLGWRIASSRHREQRVSKFSRRGMKPSGNWPWGGTVLVAQEA